MMVSGAWRGGATGEAPVQLKHLYGLIIHIRRCDKASLKFTTGNLHHMDAPNGDHRLANAISFLINRINSATLKRNDGNKNSRCDNQSAAKKQNIHNHYFH